MGVYVQLLKWTDQGRKNVGSLPDRVDAVQKQTAEMGVKIIGHYVTMGRYDQVIVCEAPDDETVAKVSVMVAGRGNVSSETMRAFTMDEVRKLM
ncbi:MAG: GYD domain-containing protein [Actinomycetota bacterium]